MLWCHSPERGDCTNCTLLQNSYYPEPEHCLELRSVDTPNRLFALALTLLEPATGYAIAPYHEAFNWADVMHFLQELCRQHHYAWPTTEFYVVDFRSQLKTRIDRPRLFHLDKESHREATQSGWLLKYWFGSPDAHRRNLATCVWRSRQDAIAGGSGPFHKLARDCALEMYDLINVRGLRLVVEQDATEW